jgi:hypothetical protein
LPVLADTEHVEELMELNVSGARVRNLRHTRVVLPKT